MYVAKPTSASSTERKMELGTHFYAIIHSSTDLLYVSVRFFVLLYTATQSCVALSYKPQEFDSRFGDSKSIWVEFLPDIYRLRYTETVQPYHLFQIRTEILVRLN
jgi:hypothetical protein